MTITEGIVTIVQESRFQLVDDGGVAHLMILGHGSAAEPDQLAGLARRQARVRVAWTASDAVIGRVAHRVTAL